MPIPVVEGLTLLTVALRAYMSFNKKKGEKRKEEHRELVEELRAARNARYPDYSRDRIAKARQALQIFEKTITVELNKEIDKSERFE